MAEDTAQTEAKEESLSKKASGAFRLSDANKRQFRAGLLTMAFGYAALGVAAFAEPATFSRYFTDAVNWAPFHFLAVTGLNFAGAAGMAIVDKIRGKDGDNKAPEAAPAPAPEAPKPQ